MQYVVRGEGKVRDFAGKVVQKTKIKQNNC